MSRPEHRKRLLLVAATVLAFVAGASGIVVPSQGHAVVTVSRFGNATRLLPRRVAFSFWPLERRISVPLANDLAQIECTVVRGDQSLRVVLGLAGSGRLLLPARDVRDHGWNAAVAAWIQRRAADDSQGLTYRATEAWRRIFPAEPVISIQPLQERLARGIGEPELRRLVIEPASPSQLRAAARAELASHARSNGGRVIVIGLDALDWRLVEELTGKGTMPNLARILARGASAAVEIPAPLISPVVWTTLATGYPPEEHGVLDFLESTAAGPRPVGSGSRRIPALWEMIAAAGRRCAVIGWWATYPADTETNLTVYSDRLTEQLIGLESDTAGLAAPADAAATARKLRLTRSEITTELLAPYLRVSEAEVAQMRAGERTWEDPLGGLGRIAAATETTRRLTLHELRRGTPVIFTYLEGTDTIGHLLGSFRPPAQPGVSRADAERFGGVVDRYYAHVDSWLGEIVAQTGAADTIVIVSDHGFTWGSDRPPVAPGARTATAEWWHRPESVFIAAGPGIQRTTARARMHALDFAPAVLAIAGVSPDAGFPGQVPKWLLHGGDLRDHASVNYAALLPRKPVPATGRSNDAGEQEQIAKLRALGYLAGGEANAGGGTNAPGDRAGARQLNNLGASQLAAGDGEAAEQSFRRAIAADPSYAAAHYNLALLYRKRGLSDDADREFWKAVDHGIADREMAIVRLALDYRQRGDAARALAVFSEGRKRFEGSESIWLNSGVFLGEQRDYDGARACLERAVAIDPRNGAAYRNLAAALAALGRREEARRALTTASRLDPSNAAIRRELSQLSGSQP